MEFREVNIKSIDEKVLKDYSKKFNINEKIVEILFKRNIDTEEKINSFLNNDINNLKDPFLLLNMQKAVERIENAVKNNEKILIFGDYDVDGICATSILYNYLITKTKNVFTYLPNRFEDGYGLTCPCLDKIAEKQKPDLIITVDCGISCYEEVEYIKKMGIDVIVTDHHELPEKLPNCIIVTTKFDQPFNFKGLCGAGVSFKIVQAMCINNSENYEKYLAISSLATIADIVPLIDENRIIVKEGLKRLELLPLGVKILLKQTLGSLKNITSTDIAFKIAPLINSSGRLDDANIALKLFISNDLKTINHSLKTLENLNNKRKSLCKSIYDDCVKLLENENKNNKVIVLYKPDWEIGLLGIVCSRISEDYNKPCILLGKINGELKGSARTNNNVNIFEMFNFAKDSLNKFGGHAKAGGLSLYEENLKQFKNLVNKFVLDNFSTDFEIVKNYDLTLNLNEITYDFVKSLDVIEPFGYENSKPIFKVNIDVLKITKMKNLPENLIITVKNDFELVSFNDINNLENYYNFKNKEMLIELSLNNFGNKKSLKGLVKAVKFSDEKAILQTKLNANLFNQLKYSSFKQNVKKYTSINQILNLKNDKTLFISYNIYNDKIKLLNNINKTTFVLNNKLGNFSLLYGIESLENFDKFDRIVFLDETLNLDFIYYLKSKFNAEIYVPLNVKEIKLNKTREELLNIYYSLIKAINKNISADNLYFYYEYLLLNYKINYSYEDFYLSILIFEELKLIKRKNNNNKISFELNKIKTDLLNSTIFNKINN